MEQVFRELGISSKSLADIDVSACDKLAEILKKYQKPEKNSYTKQYSRLNEAYNKMLQHYYAIGDGIISNFIKYSEAKDEKHSNLIVASKEKLENMWDSQKDFYNNNFSHVLIEIVSSEPYINYLDFIIEKVIPVFKSGLASDADYVLDVLPKKGEYYLLRQTGNGQAVLANGEVENGNVAIAEILGYDQSAKKMKFRLVGLVKGKSGDNWKIGGDGRAVLSTNDIDYDAYKENGEFDEDYGKWLSLDPVLLDWAPELYTEVYGRRFDNGEKKTDQFIYAYATKDEYDKGFNKFIFINTKPGTFEILSIQLFKIDNYLNVDEVGDLMTSDASDDAHNIANFNAYYKGYWSEKLRTRVKNYGGDKPEIKDVKNTDELINEINEIPEVEERDAEVKFSNVYMRTFDDGKNTNDQYVYAYGDKDDKDEFNKVALVINKKGTNEILSTGVYTLDNYFTSDDLEKLLTSDAFDPKFTDTSKNFTESQLKTYIERYKGTNNEEKDVSTTDDLADIINKKQEQKKSVRFSTIYTRDGYNGSDQRVYAYGGNDDKDEFNNVVVVNKKPDTNDIVSINTYILDSYQDASALKDFLVNAGFKYTDKNYNDSKLKEQIEKYTGTKPNPVQVHTTDELLNVLNGKKKSLNYSNLYKRTIDKITQYFFFYDNGENKNEFNVAKVVSTNSGTKNILSIDTYNLKKSVLASEIDKLVEKFNPKFEQTGIKYDGSELKGYVDSYNGKKTGIDVSDENELISSVDSVGKLPNGLDTAVKEFLGCVKINGRNFSINEESTAHVKINGVKKGDESTRISVNFKDPDIYFECFISYRIGMIKVLVNKGVISAGEKEYSTNIKINEWNENSLISVLRNGVLGSSNKSNENSGSNESIVVTYDYSSDTSESCSTAVNIIRKFDKKMKNWYVLSEAIYDDGSNKVSKLDNQRFVNSLVERSECSAFAKSSKFSKFMPYETKQTYKLVSEFNYTPSVATPLYESVLLVKFDNMDHIIDKKYLGKHKIC